MSPSLRTKLIRQVFNCFFPRRLVYWYIEFHHRCSTSEIGHDGDISLSLSTILCSTYLISASLRAGLIRQIKNFLYYENDTLYWVPEFLDCRCYTPWSPNLGQDSHGGTSCLCQRSMLVASKQVIGTMQGTLIFSNKYMLLTILQK